MLLAGLVFSILPLVLLYLTHSDGNQQLTCSKAAIHLSSDTTYFLIISLIASFVTYTV